MITVFVHGTVQTFSKFARLYFPYFLQDFVTKFCSFIKFKMLFRVARKLSIQNFLTMFFLFSRYGQIDLKVLLCFRQTHRFLFSSDVERGDWKREISTQQKDGNASLSPLSPLEIQGLAETCLEVRGMSMGIRMYTMSWIYVVPDKF